MNAAGAVIGAGARVTMHLRLATVGGDEVENTFDDEPLSFAVGDGSLVEGLESAIIGLSAGARASIELDAGRAFGERQVALINEIPRERFPDDVEPGFIWAFTSREGEELPGIVVDVAAERVVVDFNHPLAGEPVMMEFEILAVDSPSGKVEQ